MLAHKLRYKIEIFLKTKTKNSIGSFTESEVLVDSVLADVQTTMGRTATNDGKVIHSTETTFIIRNYPKVTYDHIIKYDGQTYRIIGLQPLQDRTGQIIKTVMVI
jgi:head-tail adaptor